MLLQSTTSGYIESIRLCVNIKEEAKRRELRALKFGKLPGQEEEEAERKQRELRAQRFGLSTEKKDAAAEENNLASEGTGMDVGMCVMAFFPEAYGTV